MKDGGLNKVKSVARALAVLAFWLAVWAALAALVHKELLLPRPDLVLERFFALLVTNQFWLVTASSLLRIVEGFALGLTGGGLLALLMQKSRIATALLQPLVQVVRSTPVASFIILALVWIDKPLLPVFISFLMVLPISWANLRAGLENTDRQLLEMAALFRVRRLDVWRRIYFPSLHPYLLSAATTGLGLAWKSGITAEVIAAPRLAVGSELQAAKVNLETADAFVWTLVVAILSMALEKLLLRMMKRGKARYAPEEKA